MILLGGIPSEGSVARVREALDELGVSYLFLNQRQSAAAAIAMEIVDGEVGGWLDLDGHRYRLGGFTAVFLRMMDDQLLPELAGEPPGSPLRRRCRALHDALARWSEVSSARVVNRLSATMSNSSKPYQLQVIRAQGFAVPETLITNDPKRVLAFRARHGRIIYKSMSGVRSIVQALEDRDLDRLERIRCCPTQFQQFVDGTNVRVHTVGEKVLATAVVTTATDYRYARDQVGEAANLSATELDEGIGGRCVAVARALGLAFAGVDLKITPTGEVYCFEVNPSPAFSYFEANTGQPIAREVARYLASEVPACPEVSFPRSRPPLV